MSGLSLVSNSPPVKDPFLKHYLDGNFEVLEIDDSENHDMCSKSQQSIAVEILHSMGDAGPEFGPQAKLADGHTLEEHKTAWAAYWRSYFRNAALHGINIEIASQIYAKYLFKGLFCMHDLTMDGGLQTLISDFLQIYYADVATEFVSPPGECQATRGGSKSRVYGKAAYSFSNNDVVPAQMSWYLGWLGDSCNSTYDDNIAANVFVQEATTCWVSAERSRDQTLPSITLTPNPRPLLAASRRDSAPLHSCRTSRRAKPRASCGKAFAKAGRAITSRRGTVEAVPCAGATGLSMAASRLASATFSTTPIRALMGFSTGSFGRAT